MSQFLTFITISNTVRDGRNFMIASNLFKYVAGFRKDYENERLVATIISERKGLRRWNLSRGMNCVVNVLEKKKRVSLSSWAWELRQGKTEKVCGAC